MESLRPGGDGVPRHLRHTAVNTCPWICFPRFSQPQECSKPCSMDTADCLWMDSTGKHGHGSVGFVLGC